LCIIRSSSRILVVIDGFVIKPHGDIDPPARNGTTGVMPLRHVKLPC